MVYEINYSLSAREIEIIRLLATGISPKEVALKLGVSSDNVYNRLTTIIRVFDSNKYDLVDKARKRGIVE